MVPQAVVEISPTQAVGLQRLGIHTQMERRPQMAVEECPPLEAVEECLPLEAVEEEVEYPPLEAVEAEVECLPLAVEYRRPQDLTPQLI